MAATKTSAECVTRVVMDILLIGSRSKAADQSRRSGRAGILHSRPYPLTFVRGAGPVTYQSFPHDRPLPGKLRGMVGRQLLADGEPVIEWVLSTPSGPPSYLSADTRGDRKRPVRSPLTATLATRPRRSSARSAAPSATLHYLLAVIAARAYALDCQGSSRAAS